MRKVKKIKREITVFEKRRGAIIHLMQCAKKRNDQDRVLELKSRFDIINESIKLLKTLS